MTLDAFIPQNVEEIFPGINVDCYHGVFMRFWKRFADNKKVHFELISRTIPESKFLDQLIRTRKITWTKALAPSRGLLAALKRGISFEFYKEKLERELFKNPGAVERMHQLSKMADTKAVYLICYEKDPESCHRSFVSEWIGNIENLWNVWKRRGAAVGF